MTLAPDLVLLTAAYPFGNKSETFLETEIEILAERFGRVLVLPSHRASGVRALPDNVELVEMGWLDEPGAGARQRALATPEAMGVLARTLSHPGNVKPYLGAARMYLDVLARNVLKARELRRFVTDRGLSGAIFYDYWFENTTLALALLRRWRVVGTAVCRAHGFDVYDERWDDRPVPFREAKFQELDAVFAVSGFGAAYLRSKLSGRGEKIHVSHLGVWFPPAPGASARRAGGLHVLSCGSLIPSKRVHRIPSVLRELGRPLRWTHLGDGPEAERVRQAAGALGPEVECTLPGHVDNADILRFYEREHVDVFLSMSASEGLPVSMMEAQSYGVPIVACAVHGVPEIVQPETGVLLAPDVSDPEVAVAVEEAIAPGRFDRDAIRSFFREHFEARTNYNRFADALIALREDQAAIA